MNRRQFFKKIGLAAAVVVVAPKVALEALKEWKPWVGVDMAKGHDASVYGEISARTRARVSARLLERSQPYRSIVQFRRYDNLPPATKPLVEGDVFRWPKLTFKDYGG